MFTEKAPTRAFSWFKLYRADSNQVQAVTRWLPSTRGPSATGSRLETACSRGCEYRAASPT